MKLKPSKEGVFTEEIVLESGLPVYSFEDPDDKYFPSDFWTYSDLKEVLKIHLTTEERESMIVAFQKSSRQQKGFAPLYSFQQVINRRYGLSVKFFPQFDE